MPVSVDHNAELLDTVARSNESCREFLPVAAKGDSDQIRAALESARNRLRNVGSNWKLNLMNGNLDGAPIVRMFQYIPESEDDDYISVQPFDGRNTYGEIVTIAKQLGMGRFDYDGFVTTNEEDGTEWLAEYVDINQRTLTSLASGTVELQYITPGYDDILSDRILAVTGVQGFDPVFEGNGDDVARVDWIEVSPSRHWAKAANS